MTNFRKLIAATAIMTASTLMSTAAFADINEMTCADFNAMDENGQMEAAMEYGREGQRRAGMGADATGSGVGTEQADSQNVELEADTGKQGQENMARGVDVRNAMIEHCKDGGDSRVMDTPSPAQR
ncbi:hypothetical protein [Roseovarius dicentrarchi]|uniref:hypothetical protein n=1 Tax=Roseovarius dicentrarchi TaxID=2250573 RepID=UPI000DE8E161|nr:hypothetical protein [Roseovarius dicentrarchi]